MKLSKITTLGIIAATLVTACKYEEGPRISLRSKRDRVANEWKITSLTRGANDSNIINSVNDTSTGANNGFKVVLSLYRTGFYSADVVRRYTQDGKEMYETQQDGFNGARDNSKQWSRPQFDQFNKNLPEVIARLGSNGRWTFDKGHYKIQMKPELSWVNSDTTIITQKNTIDWTIVMLKEKKMMLQGRDSKDVIHKMTLEPINDEPYWW